MTAPQLPLPGDLQARLDIILAKPAMRRFPLLCQAVTALVSGAYGRQPAPEPVTQPCAADVPVTGWPADDHRRCPDGGYCHHGCNAGECFRVHRAGPLSGKYPDDRWPDEVTGRCPAGGHP